MAVTGWTYKRCLHGITGTPERGSKAAVPACRCKKGSWYWRAEGTRDPVTGQRSIPSRGGYPTKSDAQEALADQIDAMRRGLTVADKGRTVATWLEEWFAQGQVGERAWEPTTVAGYHRHITNYLIPLIGHIRLRDLDRPAVASMLRELGKPRPNRVKHKGRGGSTLEQLSASTVDAIRRTLRSALTAAQEEGLVAINHAAGSFRQIGKRSRTPTWWQPEELRVFLDHTACDPLAAMWSLAGLAGLRRSELCGLRWVDVDLTSAQPGVTIRQRVSGVNGAHLCPVCRQMHTGRQIRERAKSQAGTDRWAPLTSETVRELLAHQAAQEAYREGAGEHYTDHGLVFAGPRGEPLRPDWVTKQHAALVAESGLPKIDLHDMRHSAASLLHAAGMSTSMIALILGHSTDEVTKAIYVHGMKDQLGKSAEAAAKLMRGGTAGVDEGEVAKLLRASGLPAEVIDLLIGKLSSGDAPNGRADDVR